MSWKELLKDLIGFSQQAEESAKEIKRQKDRELKEKKRREEYLLKQYGARVEKVINEFAHNVRKGVGKSWRESEFSFGKLPYFFSVHSREGSHDYYYKDHSIYPYVEIFSPYGIGIGIPSLLLLLHKASRLEKASKWVKSWDYKSEGNYHLVREDSYTVYMYFIPFEAFSEEKLALKLAELHKEATANYLKGLTQEGKEPSPF